jgi:WD40 repeat protein
VLADGRLVSLGEFGELLLWEPITGQSRPLRQEEGTISALTALPDGRFVSAEYKSVWLWDPAGGEHQTVGEQTNSVTALLGLSDGRLISGCDNGKVFLWDSIRGRRRTLGSQACAIASLVAVSEDRIVSADENNTLHLWYLNSRKHHPLGQVEMQYLVALAATSGDQVLSSGGEGGSLCCWDLATGESALLTGHHSDITALRVLPDGRVVSGCLDGTLHLWDLEQSRSQLLGDHHGRVRDLAILPDGRVVSVGEDNCLCIWDPAFPALTISEEERRLRGVLAMQREGGVFFAEGTRILHQKSADAQPELIEEHKSRIVALAPYGDERIVVADAEGQVFILHSTTGRYLPLGWHEKGVRVLASHPDGRIIVGNGLGDVALWDPRTARAGTWLFIAQHDYEVTAVVALADHRIISAGSEGKVLLLDHQTGRHRVLGEHDKEVSGLALLPDGRVVSSSHDRTIRLWSPEQGQVALLHCPHPVARLFLLPDSAELTIVFSGGGVGVFRIESIL